jgi:hypothetical protein
VIFYSDEYTLSKQLFKGGRSMENIRATIYFGISSLALAAGMVCMLIAAATAFADTVLWAFSTTYIQIGIAAFLFALWFGVLAIFIEIRYIWSKKG